jgi:threonine dehydrogenase-like Zn-dependent dehydrogenase
MELLRNYGVKVLVLVKFSSDRFEIIKDFFNTAKRVFSEEEDDDVAVEKVAEELTRLRFVVTNQPITVVTFYTGNETAVAFVEPYERTYT